MNARYVTLIALVLLVVASGWLLDSNDEDETAAERRPLSDGYYVLDATISDTDETGRVIYALSAERIDHVPEDGSVQLSGLNVLYTAKSEQDWSIQARRGSMAATRDVLKLRGGVEIRSKESSSVDGAQSNADDGEDSASTTILTEQLDLDMVSNVARTEQEVRIRISGGELNALGMNADLGAKKIDLLSNVSGSFGGSE